MNRKAKFLLMLTVGMVVTALSAVAFAQGAGGGAVSAATKFAAKTTIDTAKAHAAGWIGLAAGLGIGLAAFGGGMGQGRAAAAALDGIARNPGASDKIFTPFILGLALIESLVIYALIISIMLLGKI